MSFFYDIIFKNKNSVMHKLHNNFFLLVAKNVLITLNDVTSKELIRAWPFAYDTSGDKVT